MRAILLALTVLAALATAAAESPRRVSTLVFRHLEDRDVRLTPDGAANASVLFFFTSTCPVARRYVARMAQLELAYRGRGVAFVAVNASSDDSLEDVAHFAMDFAIDFPVVSDRDFSVVKALGVTRTPEVVVLDRQFHVAYQGRIDDQYRLGGGQPKATRHELADALDALLESRPVPVVHTQSEGCAVTFPVEAVPESALGSQGGSPEAAIYNLELSAQSAACEDLGNSRCEWTFEPSIAREIWARGFLIVGEVHGAELYFDDPGGDPVRHYLAGPMPHGLLLRWSEDEGVRIPAGTVVKLSASGAPGMSPTLRIESHESPPANRIQCTLKSLDLDPEHARAQSIEWVPPSEGAVPRYIAMDIAGGGVASKFEHVLEGGGSAPVAFLPVSTFHELLPTLPKDSRGPSGRGTMLRASISFPGYLRWPGKEPVSLDVSGQPTRTPFRIGVYWSVPRDSLP